MAEDIIAVGAIKALRHHKIKIPDDVCLIGFNNSIYSQCCSPTITTVDNLIETCSTTAVNILLDLFEGKQAPTRVALNSNLVVRETFLV